MSGLVVQRSRPVAMGVQYSNTCRSVLSFPTDMDHQFHVYASSGGLLLCEHPDGGFIYNPVTGEHHPIPDPAGPYFLSLSCAYGFHVYDDLRYTVLRVFIMADSGQVAILKLDSDTGKWKEFKYHIPPPHEFTIHMDRTAFVLNGRFHWITRRGTQVAVYNPIEGGSLRIISSPQNDIRGISMRMAVLGAYQGRLCCWWMNLKDVCFTMSVLEEDDCWSVRKTTSIQTMADDNEQVVGSDTIPYLACFDAVDPGTLYLEWRETEAGRFANITRYHMDNNKLDFVMKIVDSVDSEVLQYHSFMEPRDAQQD